jgi:hypothetical protein
MAAHCARVVTTPLIAQVMITLSAIAIASPPLNALSGPVAPPTPTAAPPEP